ncbi:YbjN domain-containing protein [Limnofasciculus baicalensis]|uniref:YbjN domain-containing protein n=1 Tax=Limnofasciculus baicalensis BBK-W-15 TaxID=2699891 RepID=A0AAE3GSZ1_9CYAN|nr:YbjN domain-containing protein [Limnofasciculus baicalensis]MCP2730106.1 YbjN domain-containing protein [Limnofasciculus baicalensis BBK-W-15]
MSVSSVIIRGRVGIAALGIGEFLLRINYSQILGSFDLDFSDGEIRYKTSSIINPKSLTADTIKDLVYTNLMMMEQYLPGIMKIAAHKPPLQCNTLVRLTAQSTSKYAECGLFSSGHSKKGKQHWLHTIFTKGGRNLKS